MIEIDGFQKFLMCVSILGFALGFWALGKSDTIVGVGLFIGVGYLWMSLDSIRSRGTEVRLREWARKNR